MVIFDLRRAAFESIGQERNLADVRLWVTERATDAGANIHAEAL